MSTSPPYSPALTLTWMKYQLTTNVSSKLKQIINELLKRTYFILYVFILLLTSLFFYSFLTSSTSMVPTVLRHQPHIMETSERRLFLHAQEQYILSKNRYFNQTRKSTENVIAFLVASFTGDRRLAYNPYPKLLQKISRLDGRLGDNATADLIIFHTGYPFREELFAIMNATQRHVDFVNIDHIFYKFSPSFDPYIRDPTWTKNGKWNYHHMCYFWFKQVFELKIIQRYRYMMRLDDDSEILGKWPDVFDIMNQKKLFI